MNLPKKVMELYAQRGWPLDWPTRGAYLHLEASELIEAVRGKRGEVIDEAADVLICLLAITEKEGIPWEFVLQHAATKVDSLMDMSRYKGEHWAETKGD